MSWVQAVVGPGASLGKNRLNSTSPELGEGSELGQAGRSAAAGCACCEGGQGSPEGQPWLGRWQRDRVPQRGGRHREPPVLPTVHSADTCQIPPSPDGAEPPLPVLELPGVWGPCGPQPPPSARRLTPLSLGFQQTFPVALPPSPA